MPASHIVGMCYTTESQSEPRSFLINGLLQHVDSWDWPCSHTIMFLRFTHVATCINTSFFFKAEWFITFCLYICHLMNTQQFCTIVNNAAMNIHVQVCA